VNEERACSIHRVKEKCVRSFNVKLEQKESRRSGLRQEDNIELEIKEIAHVDVDLSRFYEGGNGTKRL
jgi:hypothetical protein